MAKICIFCSISMYNNNSEIFVYKLRSAFATYHYKKMSLLLFEKSKKLDVNRQISGQLDYELNTYDFFGQYDCSEYWPEIDWNKKLIDACKNGDTQLMKQIIEQHEKHVECMYWKKGLYNACEGGHIEIVKLILEYERKFNQNIWLKDEFEIACKNGHAQVVQLLMEESKKNILFSVFSNDNKLDFEKGFENACKNGHIQVVQLIIKENRYKSLNLDWNKGLYCVFESSNISTLANLAKLIIKHGRKHNTSFDWNNQLCECKHWNKQIIQIICEESQKDNIQLDWNKFLCVARKGQKSIQTVKMIIEKCKKDAILLDLNGKSWDCCSTKLELFMNYLGTTSRKHHPKVDYYFLNRHIKLDAYCEYYNDMIKQRRANDILANLLLKRYFPSLFVKCIICSFLCYD